MDTRTAVFCAHRIRLLILPVLLTVASCFSAHGQEVREWTDSTGRFKVKASFEGINDGKIVLKRSDNGAVAELPLERLSDADQKVAKSLWFDQQDARQLAMVQDHLGALYDRPRAVGRLLVTIHQAVPESPYAGAWAAVAMAEGENRFSAASALLSNVIRRIEDQRAVSPDRHSMTLATVYNNLAICYVKERSGDKAANAMVGAMEAARVIPSVIRQNAQSLTELGSDPYSPLSFSGRNRERLLTTLATSDVSKVDTKLDDGWYYALDFNVPSNSAGANLRIDGLDKPRQDTELLSIGTGFVVAPGIVMTSRPVIETTDYDGPKLVTVGINSASKFNSLPVSHVIATASRVSASRSVTTQSRTAQGPVSQTSGWTEFIYSHPAPGSTDAEIAALQVPGLTSRPLPVVEDNPQPGTDVKLVGYVRGPDVIQKGQQTEAGQVLADLSIHGSQELSCRVRGGNRGGPVLDEAKQVVGIAYDTAPLDSNGHGLMFGAGTLRRWFYQHVQTASMSDAEPSGDGGIDPPMIESVVPVFVWGQRRQTQAALFSQVVDVSRTGGGLLIRDSWCIACGGDGFLDCANGQCFDGAVSVKKTVKIGVNPQNGSPIFATRPFREECSVCSGAGGRRCPVCKEGRLQASR